MAITVYTYNDKVLKNSVTDKWLKKYVDPYNPLGLPPNTVRVRTSDGNAPIGSHYTSATLVTGTTDIYDVYKSGTDFSAMLSGSSNLIEVLGGNTTGVTNMYFMFGNSESLTTVPLFDTSAVTDMSYMFYYTGITSIPLFDTSSVTNMESVFEECSNVTTGALALYNQASTQTTPPSNHNKAFRNCGSSTTTGAAELAQIPTSWGGTAS